MILNSRNVQLSITETKVKYKLKIGDDKNENGTKQPILKRDKTANFQNGTKQPIFKTGQRTILEKQQRSQV